MPDIDLGVATDWDEGDTHGRIKLSQNQVYKNAPAKKDVLISSPVSIELRVNTNFSSSQEADKIYFTTYHGSTPKIIAILDSSGNLHIAGQLITGQKNMTYDTGM
ncbi:DUF6342 family protein [Microtetraspora malaysiensis]|uniref:DUF6342 family protein n=1 Tax=Microtetraspora malaysiensis TaxID=161358 RepID=UPI003D8F848E